MRSEPPGGSGAGRSAGRPLKVRVPGLAALSEPPTGWALENVSRGDAVPFVIAPTTGGGSRRGTWVRPKCQGPGLPIWDPASANRNYGSLNYTDFGGYFCVGP